MAGPAALFDLDGTLCDTSSIEHLVAGESPDFPAFHAASADCPARTDVVEAALDQVRRGRCVVVVTSREFVWRDLTIDWLAAHRVPWAGLYMRVVADYRPAVVVKASLLADVRADGFEPVAAWEDSIEVIDLWRAEGIAETHLV